MKVKLTLAAAIAGLLCSIQLSGCGPGEPPKAAPAATTPAVSGISPQKFADAVHAVMMADRTVYATHVVTRLKSQEASVSPSEYWEDEEHKIPLPAQMFRMGSEIVNESPEAGFTYSLKSKWPLNSQNKAATDVEIQGLNYVAEHDGENFYGEETLGDQKYFVAIYADKAVAKACWDCHNNHANKRDDYPEFSEGDVMGGVIVRVPIE
ncbi:MAG: DUF3365 domain-containing protein [Planctomycetaceae bacterium]